MVVFLTTIIFFIFTNNIIMKNKFKKESLYSNIKKVLLTNDVLKPCLIFLIGFIGYGIIEILFRGFTHWSMLLTGGACLLSLYYINFQYKNAPIILKALGGAFIITIYELCVGIIVNLLFHFNVWSYSALPLNFLGQICPLFTLLWFLLCLVLLIISKVLYYTNQY